jgi:hypothetical protein
VKWGCRPRRPAGQEWPFGYEDFAFFRFSAQRFFIISDSRFLAVGLMPPHRCPSAYLFQPRSFGYCQKSYSFERSNGLADAVSFLFQLCNKLSQYPTLNGIEQRLSRERGEAAPTALGILD